MLGVSDFKNLKVWRKAHALALNVHRASVGMRGAQFVSLRGQLIRAAFSIPTNIVEGNGQESPQQFARFVQTVEVRKMFYGLLRHLDRSRLDPAAPKGRSAVTKS